MAESPTSVRVLPMSMKEFDGLPATEVQDRYFLYQLPYEQGGEYRYRTSGLSSVPGTRVLFQYNNQLIACADLEKSVKFDTPKGEYHGAHFFDVVSICVFDPIGAETVRLTWPDFAGFSHTKLTLDTAPLHSFMQTLTGVKAPLLAVSKAFDVEQAPPGRAQAMVSRIIRDTLRAIAVKKRHNFECQICGYAICLPDGSRYAEAHHIQPLGMPHNGPDIIENLVCLCPNHHAQCDLGVITLSLNDLRSAPGHEIAAKFIDYHNLKIAKLKQ
jgi:hypothetical protein